MSKIYLASTSRSRQSLLTNAGINYDIRKPQINEEITKKEILAINPNIKPSELALKLSEAKAKSIHDVTNNEIVIGCDQILSLDDKRFDKPKTISEAQLQLMKLNNKTHYLETAVVCIQGQKVIWSHLTRPALTMRNLSKYEIVQYIGNTGQKALETVGAYKLEETGIQLFEKIYGDYFSILGLPLLPLLKFLRQRNMLT